VEGGGGVFKGLEDGGLLIFTYDKGVLARPVWPHAGLGRRLQRFNLHKWGCVGGSNLGVKLRCSCILGSSSLAGV
jgi:hypothetical protein